MRTFKLHVIHAIVIPHSILACNNSNEPQPQFRGGPQTVPVLQTEQGVRAEQRAQETIKKQKDAVQIDQNHTFKPLDLIVDPNGTEHMRFERAYKGLNVIAGDIVTHTSVDASVAEISISSENKIDLQTTPQILEEEAKKLAKDGFSGVAEGFLKASLVVFNYGTTPQLSWEVEQSGKTANGGPSWQKTYVDAHTGRILASWENIYTVAGQGMGYYSRNVPIEVTQENVGYSLKDPTRGNAFIQDLTGKSDLRDSEGRLAVANIVYGSIITSASTAFGNGQIDAASLGVDALFYGGKTWDYFLNTFNRRGIKNDSKGTLSRVNVGTNLNNAYWIGEPCFCVAFGNGDGSNLKPPVALDVAAHEFSHGLTQNTARLIYAGESGGLNEATSDIFATMVEFYANFQNDRPDYTIGEQIVGPRLGRSALRFMHQPSLDNKSQDCYNPSTTGTLDVHHSSGVGNHFFYLLAEGTAPTALPSSPTCNNTKITGIGRDKAAKIWYRALTVYMTPTTNYPRARGATVKAAMDLFGANSVEVATTEAAWLAVSVDNTAPILSAIGNQTTNEDNAVTIPVQINDNDSVLSCSESFQKASSNTNLIPINAIVITGTAPNCRVVITPISNANGNANITLTVSDGRLSSVTSFSLTVNPINDAPKVSDVNAQTTVEDTAKQGIAIEISDPETSVACSNLNVTSNNVALVDTQGISVTGTAPNCLLSLSPRANASGSAQINLSVTDGVLTTAKNFMFSVTAVNDPPSISMAASFNLNEDVVNAQIPLQLTDIDSPINCESIRLKSTDSSIISLAKTTISGTLPNCVLNVTSEPNKYGSVGISVFVKDEITEVTKDITVNLNNLVDPPIAVINSDKIGGKAPFWVSFSAIESWGIDADIISWEWNFGDETLGLAKNFVKQYKIPGNYEVILNVKDKNGNVGTKSVKVIVE